MRSQVVEVKTRQTAIHLGPRDPRLIGQPGHTVVSHGSFTGTVKQELTGGRHASFSAGCKRRGLRTGRVCAFTLCSPVVVLPFSLVVAPNVCQVLTDTSQHLKKLGFVFKPIRLLFQS